LATWNFSQNEVYRQFKFLNFSFQFAQLMTSPLLNYLIAWPTLANYSISFWLQEQLDAFKEVALEFPFSQLWVSRIVGREPYFWLVWSLFEEAWIA
jgi:hypothetical protein